ncbi:hypothetical protein J6590_033274 [Homalodisca vitripennis]|nr:hypothetical protein J6590_033274 [Homalodisca vitripennis]
MRHTGISTYRQGAQHSRPLHREHLGSLLIKANCQNREESGKLTIKVQIEILSVIELSISTIDLVSYQLFLFRWIRSSDRLRLKKKKKKKDNSTQGIQIKSSIEDPHPISISDSRPPAPWGHGRGCVKCSVDMVKIESSRSCERIMGFTDLSSYSDVALKAELRSPTNNFRPWGRKRTGEVKLAANKAADVARISNIDRQLQFPNKNTCISLEKPRALEGAEREGEHQGLISAIIGLQGGIHRIDRYYGGYESRSIANRSPSTPPPFTTTSIRYNLCEIHSNLGGGHPPDTPLCGTVFYKTITRNIHMYTIHVVIGSPCDTILKRSKLRKTSSAITPTYLVATLASNDCNKTQQSPRLSIEVCATAFHEVEETNTTMRKASVR